MARKSKQPLKNAPTKPGYYWAIWMTPAKKTHEGKLLKLPAHPDDWQVVEVFLNHIGPEDDESLAVFVGGVRECQWLENFKWGPGIQRPDMARYR